MASSEQGAAPQPVERPTGSPGICDRFSSWVQRSNYKSMLRYLAIINILSAGLVGATYPLGFVAGEIALNFKTFWLSGYTVLFCLLWVTAELHLPGVDKIARRYFGFLFSYCGRISFAIFIASLAFSAHVDGDSTNVYWLGVVGGIVTLVGAIFNCYVFYSHPAFKSGGEMAAVGVNTGADAQQSYVVNNPTVAQGAAAGVGDPEYAQDDPFSGTGVTAQPRQRGTYEPPAAAAQQDPFPSRSTDDDNPFNEVNVSSL